MKAGFSESNITPPLGTRMSGYGGRDEEDGCVAVHDELFVRVLYLETGDEAVLIAGFDLLFFSCPVAARLKAALGRACGLGPRQILLSCSHTHAGPCVDEWSYGGFVPVNESYLDRLEGALVGAAEAARAAAVDVTVSAGAGTSRLPVCRRRPTDAGRVVYAPYIDERLCDTLPVCVFKDSAARIVSVLFSVSCHATATPINSEISADFPGLATVRINKALGIEKGALFLQGCCGDLEPRTTTEHNDGEWSFCDRQWENCESAADILAHEAAAVVGGDLVEVAPDLCAAAVTMALDLEPVPTREKFEAIRADGMALTADGIMAPSNPDPKLARLWAGRFVDMHNAGSVPGKTWDLNVQGIRLGDGLRIVAVEAEVLSPLGLQILDFYDDGVTFPLGYIDGCRCYLPASRQLNEGGYEVAGYCEYGLPSRFAPGVEEKLSTALRSLRDAGI